MQTRKVLLIGALAGVVSGIIATVNPSLPTTVWMWKERPEYRAYQIGALAITLIALVIIVYIATRD